MNASLEHSVVRVKQAQKNVYYMCVCVYVCVYAYIHIYMCVYIHIHTHI